ncbi:MAG: hypothetical protein ACTS2F_05830 [Thainema sp.]
MLNQEAVIIDNGLVIALFIAIATSIAIGYGYGVKTQRLPFSAEIGFNDKQGAFLKAWVKLASVLGVLVPLALWIQARQQPAALSFWSSYVLVVVVQLLSESTFSRWLVASVVVPIGFCYTAFRLWQLFDGFNQLSLSHLELLGFTSIVLFWLANLMMLLTIAIPTIYQKQTVQN